MFIALLAMILKAEAAEPNCIIPVLVNYETVPRNMSDKFTSALDSAIGEWNSAMDKIQIARYPQTNKEESYGAIHVKWGDVTQNVPGGLKVATTFVSTGIEDRVSRARITMDKDTPWCVAGSRDCFDLYEVFLHELGHSLGLLHSSEDNAVMFFNVLKEVRKPNITQSDRKAIRQLMPENDAGCDTKSGYLTWSRFNSD